MSTAENEGVYLDRASLLEEIEKLNTEREADNKAARGAYYDLCATLMWTYTDACDFTHVARAAKEIYRLKQQTEDRQHVEYEKRDARRQIEIRDESLRVAMKRIADLERESEGWREQVRVLKEQVAQANIDAGEAHQAAEGARILAAGLEEQMQALTKERDAARVECGLAHSAREVTVNERDAAKAEAARLREALTLAEIEVSLERSWCRICRSESRGDARGRKTHRHETSCLLASSSTDWLAKHDAEVRAQRIRCQLRSESSFALLAWLDTVFADMEGAGYHCDNDALRAQVESLTAQVVAATSDAARAELRARDFGDALQSIAKVWRDGALSESQVARALGASLIVTRRAIDAIAAAPDSDARLREVMERAWTMGATAGERGTLAKEDIDEVLGVKS